jgi:peptidylprolyl isomerase
MATPKRERQKAARAQKLEAMKKQQQRKQTGKKVLIAVIVVVLLAGSAALIFSSNGPKVATIPTTTTASSAVTGFAAIPDPSQAGTSGQAPTVVVPTTPAPTVEQVSDLIPGTGATLKVGDTFTAQYVLATYSTHKVVQSSWTSSPFTTTLDTSHLIAGWVKGMVGMKVGGRRELIIPPSLGYGSSSPGTGIAANDTLVFVVDLLKVG